MHWKRRKPMFIEALALGLIAGIVRGGRVRNLLELEIAGVSLILTAVVLQILPILLEPFIKSENWLSFLPFAGYLGHDCSHNYE